jgi:hypothetical protein
MGSKDMTEAQIKYMVDRFLNWKLPPTFSPDCGIDYKSLPSGSRPVGTNVFNATETDAMVRHMIDGMPSVGSPQPTGGQMTTSQHHLSELLQQADAHSGVAFDRKRSDEIAATVAAVAREAVQEALVGDRPSPESDLHQRAETLAYNLADPRLKASEIWHLTDQFVLPTLLSAYADGFAAAKSK